MEDGHRRAGCKDRWRMDIGGRLQGQMEDGHRRTGYKDRWRMDIGGQVTRTDGGWT